MSAPTDPKTSPFTRFEAGARVDEVSKNGVILTLHIGPSKGSIKAGYRVLIELPVNEQQWFAQHFGQKGRLTLAFDDAIQADLAEELAAAKAEISRLREIMKSMSDIEGVQVALIESAPRCAIICCPTQDEESLTKAIGDYMMDRGMQHPKTHEAIEKAKQNAKDATRAATSWGNLAMELYDVLSSIVGAVETEEAQQLVKDIVGQVRADKKTMDVFRWLREHKDELFEDDDAVDGPESEAPVVENRYTKPEKITLGRMVTALRGKDPTVPQGVPPEDVMLRRIQELEPQERKGAEAACWELVLQYTNLPMNEDPSYVRALLRLAKALQLPGLDQELANEIASMFDILPPAQQDVVAPILLDVGAPVSPSFWVRIAGSSPRRFGVVAFSALLRRLEPEVLSVLHVLPNDQDIADSLAIAIEQASSSSKAFLNQVRRVDLWEPKIAAAVADAYRDAKPEKP